MENVQFSKIIFDEQFEYAIKFTKLHEEDTHWLNFQCVEVVGQYNGNVVEFGNYEIGYGIGDCTDFDIAYKENPLCEGFIKWDGCMEVHDFNKHFCGYSDFLQRLMKSIYIEASKIIEIDEDLANIKIYEKNTIKENI